MKNRKKKEVELSIAEKKVLLEPWAVIPTVKEATLNECGVISQISSKPRKCTRPPNYVHVGTGEFSCYLCIAKAAGIGCTHDESCHKYGISPPDHTRMTSPPTELTNDQRRLRLISLRVRILSQLASKGQTAAQLQKLIPEISLEDIVEQSDLMVSEALLSRSRGRYKIRALGREALESPTHQREILVYDSISQ